MNKHLFLKILDGIGRGFLPVLLFGRRGGPFGRGTVADAS